MTHISRVTQYDQDLDQGTPERWVAHFAHPLELELVSKGAVPANKYPTMLLQASLRIFIQIWIWILRHKMTVLTK